MPKSANKVKKSFITIGIIILIIIMLFCANYLSLLFLTTTEKASTSLTSNSLTIYAISFDKSLTQAGGESLAIDYRKIGAGGYVWQEENYYYILSSAYVNENDAILVQNSVKQNHNIETSIIKLNIPSFNLNVTIDSDEKKALQKALNLYENVYKQLFDIAISLDTNVYNEISARLVLNNIFSNANTIVADYKIFFEDVESLNTLTKYLEELILTLQKLCSGITISTNQTMSSLIKYRYIEILAQAKNLSLEL